MYGSKVVPVCMFNKLHAVGLFLALDGTSTRTDPFTSGKKYRKLVNNAIFIRSESLFFVSAVATVYSIWENICHIGLWGFVI